ncbi:MAG: site-specific integrase [Xanthobacteraceae bacterium]
MSRESLRVPQRVGIRSAPPAMWSSADRRAWEDARRPAVRLERGGAAGHMKPVTLSDLERRYGYFVDHLIRKGVVFDAVGQAQAGAYITPGHVQTYVEELKARVSSVTVYGSISKLYRIARLIAPDRDFGWLSEIEKDLRAERRPKRKSHRIVLSPVLRKAGLAQMVAAEQASGLTDNERARRFRNGLMLVLLAPMPNRIKNFASLELGLSIRQVRGDWWITLNEDETKEGRPDERRIPPRLYVYLNRYLEAHRAVLLRKGVPTRALWIGRTGAAMKYCSIQETITDTVYEATNVKVSPHLFRASGATTAAILAPEQPALGTALLNQRDPRTTELHYKRAKCIAASMVFSSMIDQCEKEKSE